MKILFVAPLEKPESTAWLILKVFKNLGLNVDYFSYREESKLTSEETMNSTLKEKIQNLSWEDLVFVIKGDGIHPEVLENSKARKILWWFDFDEMKIPTYLIEWSSYFDYVFLMCFPWVAELRDIGVNAFFMPQATDPSVYYPTAQEPKYKCDMTFIGSWKPGREYIITSLKKEFDVKVFGNDWPYQFKPNYPVYLNEFNKVCSSAQIVLNITPSRNWPIYDGTFSQRIYMVMAAGGILFTDNIPGLKDFFGVSKTMVIYSSTEDLINKAKQFLQSKEDEKNIRYTAREEIIKHHTYYHRIKEIFKCLKLLPSVL